jgi:hypothetical protein
LENRNQEALVNVASQMASRLQESLEQHLSFQPYVDGDDPANSNSFHGLQSFTGYTETLDSSGTELAEGRNALNNADKYFFPSDTYAGISTELGYYGGGRKDSSTDQWPTAPCDPELDFYSPVLVNYSCGDFGGTTWADNCVAATREGIHQCRRNDSKDAAIDMVVMDRSMYIDYLNKLDSKERAIITRENSLRSYGFSDVFEQDGVEITSEYACPTGKAFGLSIGNMELRCLENQLFVAEGPYFSEETQAYRYSCSTLGNMRFRTPRNFFMLDKVL